MGALHYTRWTAFKVNNRTGIGRNYEYLANLRPETQPSVRSEQVAAAGACTNALTRTSLAVAERPAGRIRLADPGPHLQAAAEA
jgi:hypothetical protein